MATSCGTKIQPMLQTVTLFDKLHALQQNLLFTFKIQQMKEACYDVVKCIIVSSPPLCSLVR